MNKKQKIFDVNKDSPQDIYIDKNAISNLQEILNNIKKTAYKNDIEKHGKNNVLFQDIVKTIGDLVAEYYTQSFIEIEYNKYVYLCDSNTYFVSNPCEINSKYLKALCNLKRLMYFYINCKEKEFITIQTYSSENPELLDYFKQEHASNKNKNALQFKTPVNTMEKKNYQILSILNPIFNIDKKSSLNNFTDFIFKGNIKLYRLNVLVETPINKLQIEDLLSCAIVESFNFTVTEYDNVIKLNLNVFARDFENDS